MATKRCMTCGGSGRSSFRSLDNCSSCEGSGKTEYDPSINLRRALHRALSEANHGRGCEHKTYGCNCWKYEAQRALGIY